MATIERTPIDHGDRPQDPILDRLRNEEDHPRQDAAATSPSATRHETTPSLPIKDENALWKIVPQSPLVCASIARTNNGTTECDTE